MGWACPTPIWSHEVAPNALRKLKINCTNFIATATWVGAALGAPPSRLSPDQINWLEKSWLIFLNSIKTKIRGVLDSKRERIAVTCDRAWKSADKLSISMEDAKLLRKRLRLAGTGHDDAIRARLKKSITEKERPWGREIRKQCDHSFTNA
jgi:hypothetical protein